jgi:hypothetical protein
VTSPPSFGVTLAGVVALELLLVVTGNPVALVLPFAFTALVLIFNARDSALVLACVGLITISWDRVSIRVGGMTLKPAYVAFTMALLIIMFERRLAGAADNNPGARNRLRIIRSAVAVSLVLLCAATVANGYLLEGGRQLFAIVVGALIPAWVCYHLARSVERRNVLLSWALIGAGVAAAFGVCQFAARYVGLPTPLPYEGVGGDLGRTAGFSYEPAFFSMYLVSLIPLVTVVLLERRGIMRHQIRCAPRALFFLLVIGVFVGNARAAYLVLPLAVLLPLLSRGPARPVKARPITLAFGAAAAVVVVSFVVGFDVGNFLQTRFASITDTNEAASNAPRLLLYDTSRRIAGDHPVLGIGPGALGQRLPEYGLPLESQGFSIDPSRAVANNIWLQAALDAGIAAVAALAAIVAGVFALARRCRDLYGRQLAVGCLLVLSVGGLLTSIAWDAKYWVLIGLALAADMSVARVRDDLVSA